jgi:hypothetical protein
MILKFAFQCSSTAQVLEKILFRALHESALEGKITKDDEHIALYIRSDDDEALRTFATTLSTELPHSIFINSSSVEVVEAFPNDSYVMKEFPKRELPFCPRCLKEALQEHDPFVCCEVCGYETPKSPLLLKNFSKELHGNNEEIFRTLASLINNGAVAKVKTLHNTVLLGLLNEANMKNRDDFTVLCVDLAAVSSVSDMTQGEILAIASFEKPLLKLAPNRVFNEKYPHILNSALHVQMSDNLMLQLICNALRECGIEHLFMAKDDGKHHHVSLDFQSRAFDESEPLEVMVLENGLNVVTKGERGILPQLLEGIDDELFAHTHKYESININKTINIFKKEHFAASPSNRLFYAKHTTDVLYKGIEFAACHGAFYSVIAQNDLNAATSLGLYFSKEHSNKIMINSPKFGLVDYVEFTCKFKTIDAIFKAISDEGDSARELVKNYDAAFGDTLDKESILKPYGAEILRLWGIVAIILGIEKSSDAMLGGQKILDLAFSFKGKRGPRIDYKLKYGGLKPSLDVLMVIRTAMSFKLAGIDNPTLCFGIVESFAEFLSDTVDEISKDYSIEAVCISGSLFESKNLLNKFYQMTSKNFSVYFNKEMPLDNVNLGYGIIQACV